MEILGMTIIVDALSIGGIVVGILCIIGVLAIACSSECGHYQYFKRCRGFRG